jgi:hypothetical protein
MARVNLRLLLGGGALLAAVLATYSNHFQNSFHFDDFHSITDNPSIRDLHNVLRFFSDARLSTVLPANQTYRSPPRPWPSTIGLPAATGPSTSTSRRSSGT